MNIDTGQIYPSKEAALKDGVPEDKLIEGTPKAIDEVLKKLFPKHKRYSLNPKNE